MGWGGAGISVPICTHGWRAGWEETHSLCIFVDSLNFLFCARSVLFKNKGIKRNSKETAMVHVLAHVERMAHITVSTS